MNIDPKILNNTPFTLVVWRTENGQDKATVYKRLAKWLSPVKSVSIHEINSETPIMLLKEDSLHRIQKAQNEKMKEILLGAEYFINLTMEDLPADTDINNYAGKPGA